MDPSRHNFPMRRIAHAATLLLGLLFAAWAFTFELGSISQVGPGLWPFIAACTMVLGSVYTIVRERSDEDYEPITRNARQIGVALVLLAVSTAVFSVAGLTIAVSILLFLWLLLLGRETLKTTILVTAGGVVVIYVVFDLLLGIPFPEDVVLDLIGI